MKAIGYIRVSTDKQSEEGVSLEMQTVKIRAYCELNDMALVEIIDDAGISAKDIKGRPGFQRALDMVLKGDVDALVVFKLDRAFRSTKDAIETADAFNRAKKGFHSISEKLDTTSAMGEFFFTIMAALGQLERRMIGERTKAAMGQMKRNGEKTSSRAPYGFRYEDNIAVPDEHERACLEVLRELREKNPAASLHALARGLEDRGFLNRNGGRFLAGNIKKMLVT